MVNADDINMQNIDFRISSFVLFDDNFDEALDVSQMVKDMLPMLGALDLVKKVKESISADDLIEQNLNKDKLFKMIFRHGYNIALKTYAMKNKMQNFMEIKFSIDLERDYELANRILDQDEMNDFNSGRIEHLNQKYNLVFGVSNYHINIHWINFKTGKSRFFSSKMEKNEDGTYRSTNMFENYTCNLFQKSIRLYRIMAKQIVTKTEEEVDLTRIKTQIKPSLREFLKNDKPTKRDLRKIINDLFSEHEDD